MRLFLGSEWDGCGVGPNAEGVGGRRWAKMAGKVPEKVGQ